MKGALMALRSVCLAVGLLVAVVGSAAAQCPASPFVTLPVNFGAQAVGTTSAPLVVFSTGGNTSTALATTIVGPNASEFAVTSNTCTGGVPCSITATFTPAACGPRVAFLVLTTVTSVSFGSSGFFPAGCPLWIVPLVGTGIGAPVVGPALTFPSTLAGMPGACVDLPIPPNTTASIVGPNFTVTPVNATTVRVCFSPLAAACGTVTNTLTFTSTLTGCPVATFALSGFACSFTCAIGLTGSDSVFSAAGRRCVIDSLNLAAISTGLTRCAALRCAECCAESELATKPAGSIPRAAVQAVLDQIRCLEAFFGCAPFPC